MLVSAMLSLMITGTQDKTPNVRFTAAQALARVSQLVDDATVSQQIRCVPVCVCVCVCVCVRVCVRVGGCVAWGLYAPRGTHTRPAVGRSWFTTYSYTCVCVCVCVCVYVSMVPAGHVWWN
jgi:thiamine transporter ThiT